MDSRLKIVLAPDSFKGSLTSTEAARAMARGVGKALPEAELVLLPLSDGGEGLVESLVVASGGELLEYEVTGPLGTPVKAQLGLMGGGKTAVIEMAQASGLVWCRRKSAILCSPPPSAPASSSPGPWIWAVTI